MDIYIGGVLDRNAALHGDVVAVQLWPCNQWRVLYKQLDAFLELNPELKELVYRPLNEDTNYELPVTNICSPINNVKSEAIKEDSSYTPCTNSQQQLLTTNKTTTSTAVKVCPKAKKHSSPKHKMKTNNKQHNLDNLFLSTDAEEVKKEEKTQENICDGDTFLNSSKSFEIEGTVESLEGAHFNSGCVVPPHELSGCETSDNESVTSDIVDVEAVKDDKLMMQSRSVLISEVFAVGDSDVVRHSSQQQKKLVIDKWENCQETNVIDDSELFPSNVSHTSKMGPTPEYVSIILPLTNKVQKCTNMNNGSIVTSSPGNLSNNKLNKAFKSLSLESSADNDSTTASTSIKSLPDCNTKCNKSKPAKKKTTKEQIEMSASKAKRKKIIKEKESAVKVVKTTEGEEQKLLTDFFEALQTAEEKMGNLVNTNVLSQSKPTNNSKIKSNNKNKAKNNAMSVSKAKRKKKEKVSTESEEQKLQTTLEMMGNLVSTNVLSQSKPTTKSKNKNNAVKKKVIGKAPKGNTTAPIVPPSYKSLDSKINTDVSTISKNKAPKGSSIQSTTKTEDEKLFKDMTEALLISMKNSLGQDSFKSTEEISVTQKAKKKRVRRKQKSNKKENLLVKSHSSQATNIDANLHKTNDLENSKMMENSVLSSSKMPPKRIRRGKKRKANNYIAKLINDVNEYTAGKPTIYTEMLKSNSCVQTSTTQDLQLNKVDSPIRHQINASEVSNNVSSPETVQLMTNIEFQTSANSSPTLKSKSLSSTTKSPNGQIERHSVVDNLMRSFKKNTQPNIIVTSSAPTDIKNEVCAAPVCEKNKNPIQKKRDTPNVMQVMQLKEWQQFVQKTGHVCAITELKHSRMAAGTLKAFPDENKNFARFVPNDNRIPNMKIPVSLCPPNFMNQVTDYEKIIYMAKITNWDNVKYALGMLVKDIGFVGELQAETEASLLENGVEDFEFPETVLNELPSLPWNIPAKELSCRVDLRRECIFTIDPKNARDLDDALSCVELANGNLKIGVHIADVTFFVGYDTLLDRMAAHRATSVYLCHKVVPMLPRTLCENLCSLNPGEDRLTVSVFWEISSTGELLSESFHRSVIRSCCKLSYNHAQLFIDDPQRYSFEQEDLPPIAGDFKVSHISKAVNMLNKIAVILRKKRFDDGALKLQQVKISFNLDEETKKPIGYSIYEIKDSHKLIEEFMLLANITVSRKIYSYFPRHALLRRHPPPSQNALNLAILQLESLGIYLDSSSAGSLNYSIEKYIGSDEVSTAKCECIINMCSRAMQHAKYFVADSMTKIDDFRHYALNVPFYTHFTSPIRRYADVVVHRLLVSVITSANTDIALQFNIQMLDRIAEHCNDRKVAAKIVQETSNDLFLAEFVRQAGELIEDGIIIGVLDRAVDILLYRLGVIRRCYVGKLPLEEYNYMEVNGKSTLHLKWMEDPQHNLPSKDEFLSYFDSVSVSLKPFVNDALKFNAFILRKD